MSIPLSTEGLFEDYIIFLFFFVASHTPVPRFTFNVRGIKFV